MLVTGYLNFLYGSKHLWSTNPLRGQCRGVFPYLGDFWKAVTLLWWESIPRVLPVPTGQWSPGSISPWCHASFRCYYGRFLTRGRTNRLGIWPSNVNLCRTVVDLFVSTGKSSRKNRLSRWPNIRRLVRRKGCSFRLHIRRFVRLKRFVRSDDLFFL